MENHVNLAVSGKHGAQCVQFPHNAPNGPDVYRRVVILRSQQYFGSSIPPAEINRAKEYFPLHIVEMFILAVNLPGRYVFGIRQNGPNFSSKAKVGNLHKIRAHAEQVFGLDVTMKEAMFVHE